MKICVTGHRPNKLWGYDQKNPKYADLAFLFMRFLLHANCTEAITGMALGTDTVFAQAVIGLKRYGVDMKLTCAIPCQDFEKNWNEDSQRIYHKILKRADRVVLVSDEKYSPRLFQLRNEWMADNADVGLAIWDGSKSGTANCVEYMKSLRKKIFVFDPKNI